MNLLQPLILFRLLASVVATGLFGLAALSSLRILRHFHIMDASEGQLALERQAELAGTLARVGAVVQVGALLMSVLSADWLATSIRGAMCGYGVVNASAWGWASLGVTVATSIAAGTLLQLFALDNRVRGTDLLRPLAWGSLLVAPLAAMDLALSAAWLLRLDLSVVASCCSVGLDAAADQVTGYGGGPRVLFVACSVIGVPLVIGLAARAAKRPSRVRVALAGAATLLLVPAALGAVVLEVAPHVYEVPGHLCPFCLFRGDAHFIGYPLFGTLFYAAVTGFGSALAAIPASSPSVRAAFVPFAKSRMRRQAFAWGAAFFIGSAPVLLYAFASGGASLFR